MWYGEWALSTNFNATDDFMYKWADAQKLKYSESSGWLVCCPSSFDHYLFAPIPLQVMQKLTLTFHSFTCGQFWSFKLEATNPLSRQW